MVGHRLDRDGNHREAIAGSDLPCRGGRERTAGEEPAEASGPLTIRKAARGPQGDPAERRPHYPRRRRRGVQGYRLDPDWPRDPAGVRLDEAEAAVVRDLFAWFADEGTTIYELRRRLDQLGVVSPRGCRTWNGSALHGVPTNPTYLGQVFANRVRTRPAERRRSALLPVGRSGTGATRAVDAAEWIAVAPVPAIVSQAQFDRAQERLAYNRRMARRNNRVHPYLLRGLVSCGRCRLGCSGLHMPTGYDYYVCRTKTRSQLLLSGERCPARYIPARALEELVWRDLCEVLATPEMIAHAMERARGGHWLPQELQARQANLRRGRAALDQQVERLTDAYLAGVVPLPEYERRRRDADARLQALDRQEHELAHDAERQDDTAGLAAHAEAFCQRVRKGLAKADFSQKRALLELLVDRVIVTDGVVEIRYVVPTGPEGEREPFWRLRSDYRNGDVPLQGPDRQQTSRPDSVCPENRGQGRLLGAEPPGGNNTSTPHRRRPARAWHPGRSGRASPRECRTDPARG